MKFKQLILLMTLGSLLLNFANAQSQSSFTKSQVINASADDVWERLRQLDGLEEIIPNFLADSWIIDNVNPGPGAKRSCSAPGTTKGEASYTEQIIDYSDDARYYTYALVEGVPAKGMINSLRVVDLGFKKCMVVWTSDREEFIKNPQMTEEQFDQFLSSAGDAILAGLVRLHDAK